MLSDLVETISNFRFPSPVAKLEETGERYISGVLGDIQNEHYHRYLFALRYCTGKDVLDIASGEGYGSYLLSQAARTVIGVDIHRPAVDYANRTYLSNRVSYKHGDATEMPIADASVDVVVSFETLEHFLDHERFCREVERVLRPGGLLIISSPNRTIYTEEANHKNEFHIKELDRSEFTALIAAHFRNYALFTQRAILGSVIMADPPNQPAEKVEGFETADGLLFNRADLADRVPYFIALASNAELPRLRSSVMHNPLHLETLDTAHGAQTATLAAVQAEVERLREVEKALERARSLGEATLAEVQEIAEAQRAAATVEIVSLKKELEGLDLERQALTQAVLAKTRQIERDQLEAERARCRLSEEGERSRIEAAQLIRRLEGQDDTLRRLETENRYLKSSLSWRVTAPLRSIAYRFPGPLRLLRRLVRTARLFRSGNLRARLRIRLEQLKVRRVILRSGLFDQSWYRAQYPDVAQGGIDPILQFLADGAVNGRNPGPNFSVVRYCRQNPDVAVSGINPLLHYILYGKSEGRAALPVPVRSPINETRWLRRSSDEDYDDWIQSYDTPGDDDILRIRAAIEAMPSKPFISIIMPVYNPPASFLARAIESVLEQIYPCWELCIADDASTEPAVAETLSRYAARDERIKIVRRSTNGHISVASNTALELATGDYVALLDHDDELAAHALFCVAREIVLHPDTDMLFSDEDKIDASGFRSAPYFKSDWDPDLILSQNAFCHLGVFRRSLLEQVGGFRVGYEGSQDHDLVLRVSELTTPRQIRHIPRILYHWRMIQGSTATAASEKPYAWLAGKRAIEEHLQRVGHAAKVLPAAGGAFYRISYDLPAQPRVSIIVPTRDEFGLLKDCIDSLCKISTYRNIEIIIVDNGSVEPKTLAYLDDLARSQVAKVIRDDRTFNYSRLNNAAAQGATGDYLCLLNNDTVVISPDWLHEMVSLAARPGVGVVGAMLYYDNETIQHAGVVVGIGGVAGHVHRALPRGDFGYFGRAAITQNLSAVTGACLLTPRALYRELGGLNERDLAVAFNDVDYCLRVREAGHRVVWTPFAELYHRESASRGTDLDGKKRKRFVRETEYMKSRWGRTLLADPYFNPNLDLTTTTPRISLEPRLPPLSMG